MNLKPIITKAFRAKLQYAGNGHCFGAAIYLPRHLLDGVVPDGAEELEYNLIRSPSRLLIEIVGGGGSR